MKAKLKSIIVNGLWHGASRVLEHDKPTAVAVTGSVGKTTTKEAIAHLLSGGSRSVRKAAGNLNTEFGVPLVIMGHDKAPRRSWQWLGAWLRARGVRTAGMTKDTVLVLEFASEQAGDIAFLAERVPLQVAVFTLFSPSHLSMNVAEVRKEKSQMIKALSPTGVIVANIDDPEQTALCADRRAVTYGYDPQATVRLKNVTMSADGVKGDLMYRDRKYPFQTALLGKHQASSIAAAVAVGIKLGYKIEDLLARAKTFSGLPGRLRLIEGRKKMTIIDDTYNSSPAAVVAALDVLAGLAEPGRRTVAIMGNMNALGRETVAAHLELGREVARHKIDFLIAVGPNAGRIIKGAKEGEMADQHVIDFETPERLLTRLDNLIQAKDIILVKGSQNGMLLERVVKVLMAHPEKAKELLVRQR